MHQPLPKLPIDFAQRGSEEELEQMDASPRPSRYSRAVLVLLVGFVLAFAGSSLPIFHRSEPVHSAPVTVGKVVLDPDGDDPRLDLLYHWQDPRFSREEHRQIFWMANGLAVLGIFIFGKRILREARQ